MMVKIQLLPHLSNVMPQIEKSMIRMTAFSTGERSRVRQGKDFYRGSTYDKSNNSNHDVAVLASAHGGSHLACTTAVCSTLFDEGV